MVASKYFPDLTQSSNSVTTIFYAISWDYVETKYKLNWNFEDNNNRVLTGQPMVGFISQFK